MYVRWRLSNGERRRENHSLVLNYTSAAVAVGVALEKSNLHINQIPRLPYF